MDQAALSASRVRDSKEALKPDGPATCFRDPYSQDPLKADIVSTGPVVCLPNHVTVWLSLSACEK